MKVVVNKILPFSSVDGPGNRSVVFLQGCNINCRYCHNPETRELCTGCGRCLETCPAGALSRNPDYRPGSAQLPILYDPAKCVLCDCCIKGCPQGSSPRTALMSPEEVFEKVSRQLPFIRGLTVSGGECMLRPDFLTELFRLAKVKGLHTLIDSNGTIDFETQPELLALTDGVMLDIKATSDEDHLRITGHSNKTVLKNAAFLAGCDKLFEVRVVTSPDLFDPEDNIRRLGELLLPLYREHPFRIKLITYRPMGVRPAYAAMRSPSPEELGRCSSILSELGYRDIVLL